jgi:hypothetical protein
MSNDPLTVAGQYLDGGSSYVENEPLIVQSNGLPHAYGIELGDSVSKCLEISLSQSVTRM